MPRKAKACEPQTPAEIKPHPLTVAQRSKAYQELTEKFTASHGRITLKSSAARLQEALRICEVAPELELILMAKDPNLPPDLRAKIFMWLGNKLIPDLKSVDIQADVKRDVQITVKSFTNAKDVVALAKHVTEAEGGKPVFDLDRARGETPE
jgi:hypothetical protein